MKKQLNSIVIVICYFGAGARSLAMDEAVVLAYYPVGLGWQLNS